MSSPRVLRFVLIACVMLLAVSMAVRPAAAQEQEPIVVQADQIVYDQEQQRIDATGHVRIRHRGATVEAERAAVDLRAQRLVATGNVVFTDFRSVDPVPVGNRFLIYTLFPEVNVSLLAYWAPRRERVALSAGWSIFNRTCKTKLGVLMSLYGGGGQKGAGACMLDPGRADVQIQEIIATLKRKG